MRFTGDAIATNTFIDCGVTRSLLEGHLLTPWKSRAASFRALCVDVSVRGGKLLWTAIPEFNRTTVGRGESSTNASRASDIAATNAVVEDAKLVRRPRQSTESGGALRRHYMSVCIDRQINQ